MGAGTDITFTLVYASPTRLRYRITGTGAGTPPTVLPNAGGVSPDLRTDAEGASPGSGRNLLLEILSTPAATQAAARKLLQGELGGAELESESEEPHARIEVQLRDGSRGITVDANEGAAAGSVPSAGFAVIVVDNAGSGTSVAGYIDVIAAYSEYE